MRSCWKGRSAPGKPRSPAPSCAPPAADPGLDVPSPSYTLVQSYDTRNFRAHHFDLWRLDGPQSLAELGWDDARADLVLVEWPDRLGALRPDDALTVTLAAGAAEEARRATLAGWPDRIGALG